MISINRYCPRSGKPVSKDSLTEYREFTVGFCNPACRDDFAANPAKRISDSRYFDGVIQERFKSSRTGTPSMAAPELEESAALVLIDIQNAFDDPKWGERNNPQAEENAARLLAGWRTSKRPVAHVQHRSLKEGSLFRAESRSFQIKDIVRPEAGEPVFVKLVNSAFIGTGLEAWLKNRGCQTIVFGGLATPHCVSTTVRMAANLGFKNYFVADAIAAFALTGPEGRLYSADEIHDVSIATLHDEFAAIINTETALQMAANPSPGT